MAGALDRFPGGISHQPRVWVHVVGIGCYGSSLMISSIPTSANTSMRPCLRLQLLTELLRGFNVSVVTYVRDALPMLLSLHYQTQTGGSVPGRTARW